MAITLQIKDSDNEVQQVSCDDFSFFIDTCNLHLYEGKDEKKVLIGAFKNVVYWKVVEEPSKE